MLKRSDYIPRHAQFEPLEINHPAGTREVVTDVPVLADDGSIERTYQRSVEVPVKEIVNKFTDADFKLSSLLAAGVPLDSVSIVDSNERSLDFANYLAGKIDSIQHLVVDTQKTSVPNPVPSENNVQS